MKKEILLMAGPTAIPEKALVSMNRQVMFHRSPEFQEISKELNENLKVVFQTKQEVLTLTGSGTAAMEAAIVNCFSPQDEVIVVVLGVFSARMASMCEAFGLKVKRVEKAYGEVASVEDVMSCMTENTKGVFVIHNESATGVTSDIKAFGEALKDTNALLVVDSVSGIGALEFRMDEWHVDVALTGSQKALMGPPGLSLIALSEKAWKANENARLPRFYFDLSMARKYALDGQHPWTPAVYQIIGLNETVKMIVKEGMENVYMRHVFLSDMVVNGMADLGILLFTKDKAHASKSVNTFYYKKSRDFVKLLLEDYGIRIYGGQHTLNETTFRVGTMGYVAETDIQAFLYAAKKVLEKLEA